MNQQRALVIIKGDCKGLRYLQDGLVFPRLFSFLLWQEASSNRLLTLIRKKYLKNVSTICFMMSRSRIPIPVDSVGITLSGPY